MSIKTAKNRYAAKTVPDGLDMRCCIEAMSSMVKTVKDHVATKT